MAETTQSQNLTIWVDVEDFFHYFEANPRPSGIQRLVFETLKVLPARASLIAAKPRIAFVRHSADAAMLSEVVFDELVEMFDRHAGMQAAKRDRAQAKRPTIRKSLGKRLRLGLIAWLQLLPAEVSAVLLRAGVLQMAAIRQFRQLRAASPRRPSPPWRKGPSAPNMRSWKR